MFRGTGFGADGEAFGEAVFNTGMAGYQEVLTDPSYAGQIVAMTAPQQGNYGVNRDDAESVRVQVSGFVVREASRRTSSWRADGSLADELSTANVVGIEGIDTRRLTLRLREHGAMRAAISTIDVDAASLVATGPGLAARWRVPISRGRCRPPQPYEAATLVGPADRSHGTVFRVAAYDYGMKRNILRRLAAIGCETTVFPAETPAGRDRRRRLRRGVPVERTGRPGGHRVRHRRRPRPDRQGADLRDLPRPSAARAGARRPDVQDAVRPSRCEPAGEEPPDRASSRSPATTTGSPSTRRAGRAPKARSRGPRPTTAPPSSPTGT